ncbi:MAG: response regulator [Sulfuritalea sp.]|nr:response regulator [Sulfuritalea sp.]MDP1983923.1 response regulator [Sulfuritalea sp.]
MDTAHDHILIVDDDPQIRALLGEHLARQGFRVSSAGNGREMRALLAQSPVDLVVLDLLLPGEDGLSLFRALKDSPHRAVPVVMLTALSDDVDRIVGLELGADDYVSKPFAPRELIARIRSVLRRARMLPPGQRPAEALRFSLFGDWALDTVERHLVHCSGTVSVLTSAEYSLLVFLLDRAQQVVSRDQLLIHLVGRDAEAFDRSIDLRISRLRKRLGDDAREAGYIKTIRNEGYVFCKAVTAQATLPHRAAG